MLAKRSSRHGKLAAVKTMATVPTAARVRDDE
jgi:hypothetical protein